MEAIELISTEDRFVISIDKRIVDRAILLLLIQRFWIEHLAHVVNFDESILDFAEEIKETWWAKNQERIFKRMAI